MAAAERTSPGAEGETRARIVQAARDLVVERGYQGLSTGEVLSRASVSRGGLYHHFASKDELIAAVLDAVERDFMLRLAQAVAEAPDALSALTAGAQWYLDECLSSRELQRVALVEGRKALGWDAWREVVDPYGVSMLSATLEAAMDEGRLVRVAARELAYILLAALHEAAAMIMAAEDKQAARGRAGEVVGALLEGLGGGREP